MPYNKIKSDCVKIVLRKEERMLLQREADKMGLPLATYIRIIIAERVRR